MKTLSGTVVSPSPPHPALTSARTPAFLVASNIVLVMAAGSSTTTDPKPMYTGQEVGELRGGLEVLVPLIEVEAGYVYLSAAEAKLYSTRPYLTLGSPMFSFQSSGFSNSTCDKKYCQGTYILSSTAPP